MTIRAGGRRDVDAARTEGETSIFGGIDGQTGLRSPKLQSGPVELSSHTPTKLPPPAAHLKNNKTRSGPHPASDLDRCQSRELGSAAPFRDGTTIPLPLSDYRFERSSITFDDETSGGREDGRVSCLVTGKRKKKR